MMKINDDILNRVLTMAKEYGATRLILFGSVLQNPETAHDLDLACDGIEGWKFYEFGARLEEDLRIPLDIVPLSPPNAFTRIIEKRGKVLL